MKTQFITVTDHTGRNSSLMIAKDHLKVVGVLPHCHKIVPASRRDALAMIEWMESWLDAHTEHSAQSHERREQAEHSEIDTARAENRY